MQTRFPAPVNKPLVVLLVEADPGDVIIAREAMAAGRLSTELHVVSDGVKAMAYLRPKTRTPNVHDPICRCSLSTCPECRVTKF